MKQNVAAPSTLPSSAAAPPIVGPVTTLPTVPKNYTRHLDACANTVVMTTTFVTWPPDHVKFLFLSWFISFSQLEVYYVRVGQCKHALTFYYNAHIIQQYARIVPVLIEI